EEMSERVQAGVLSANDRLARLVAHDFPGLVLHDRDDARLDHDRPQAALDDVAVILDPPVPIRKDEIAFRAFQLPLTTFSAAGGIGTVRSPASLLGFPTSLKRSARPRCR